MSGAVKEILTDAEFRDELVNAMPALRAFARGLCGHREMADDLAQDAMMRAWAARDHFEKGTNFRAWIYIILRNQFYTLMRKNSRLVQWDPEIRHDALVALPDQHDAIHLKDVERALLSLPPEQREVLVLVGASGVSYEEAANIIGCAVGTIKSRLARGRVALAALINGPESADAGPGNAGPPQAQSASSSDGKQNFVVL
jgi:RNA polymerase sigma-70 factor (ECF subfamily)